MNKFIKIVLIFLFIYIVTLPAVSKTYYGFGFDIIPKYINKATKMTISNVVPGSSAANNNIKNGDIIKEINGEEFSTPDYTKVFNVLYMNTSLQILLENNSKPIEVVANVPISDKDLKTLKYLGKYAKCLTKKKIKKRDATKAFLYLNKAIINDPYNVYLRQIRATALLQIIKDNFDNTIAEILIQDFLVIYDITKDPEYLRALGYIYI